MRDIDKIIGLIAKCLAVPNTHSLVITPNDSRERIAAKIVNELERCKASWTRLPLSKYKFRIGQGSSIEIYKPRDKLVGTEFTDIIIEEIVTEDQYNELKKKLEGKHNELCRRTELRT